jgi:hypothetical protein
MAPRAGVVKGTVLVRNDSKFPRPYPRDLAVFRFGPYFNVAGEDPSSAGHSYTLSEGKRVVRGRHLVAAYQRARIGRASWRR